MKVIDKHKLMEVNKLKEGEVFEAGGALWFISDFNSNNTILCIDIESGHAQFFYPEYEVTPLTAEVHIL